MRSCKRDSFLNEQKSWDSIKITLRLPLTYFYLEMIELDLVKLKKTLLIDNVIFFSSVDWK